MLLLSLFLPLSHLQGQLQGDSTQCTWSTLYKDLLSILFDSKSPSPSSCSSQLLMEGGSITDHQGEKEHGEVFLLRSELRDVNQLETLRKVCLPKEKC